MTENENRDKRILEFYRTGMTVKEIADELKLHPVKVFPVVRRWYEDTGS